MKIALILLAAVLPAASQSLPSSERWRAHLADELMPFWMYDGAFGEPAGAFPSVRCDDGSAVDFARPCPEVRANSWLLQRQRYLVAQSRQTYAYGVAYHVTGDPRYLERMKAGVAYIRANAVDRAAGGLFTLQNTLNGAWGPRMEFRNPQELAYGLLGLTMYYYLTRDPEVLPDILAARDHIFSRYLNPELGALQWVLAPNGADRPEQRRLVAQLDQMNAYLVMLATLLPEPQRAEAIDQLRALARILIDRFYSSDQNLFFLSANSPADLDISRSATDFGHTIKSMWMIRFTGRLAGDPELIDFAERNGRRVLERAFQSDSGSWASGVKIGGDLDLDKSWWIYAELDQFAASLSLADRDFDRYLARTYDYWLTRFVDPVYGEVWTTVDGVTHQPQATALPKAWPWKNGYHSTEHALVAYITSLQKEGYPVGLYYAFVQGPTYASLRPYFFAGDFAGWEDFGDGRHRVTYTNVR